MIAAWLMGLGLLAALSSLRWLRPRGTTDQVTVVDHGRGWEWWGVGPWLGLAGMALALVGLAWFLVRQG